ncbi:MAG TPA: DUF2252 family protein, partial [Holophagaceae bacterium]|nr:DUF2252 family protein [Holophagaceae bacterium]
MVFQSIADRRAAGKALRDQLSRTGQGDWKAPGPRPDLIPRLREAVAGRQADLLPLRWGRMAQSPLRFYRGSAALLAADLGSEPTAGIDVGLCGDAHLLNLGAYADPEGRLVFDLNDFDEACRGPFEWDLKRLAASVVLAGREAGHRDARAQEAVSAMVASWRASLHRYAELPAREVARVLVRAEDGRKPLAPVFAQAALDAPAALLAKAVTREGSSGWTFREQAPLVTRLTPRDLAAARAALPAYLDTLAPERRQVMERYEVVDGSRRVLGCGSIGVLNWVL